METIKLSSYPAYLLGQLKHLQNEAALCDVTLRGEDGDVSAHSLVLLAATPYFENKLLKQASGEAEVVVFENVSVNIIEAVVQFMYSGELAASGDDVDKMIEFCEELKLTQVVDAYRERLVKPSDKAQQEKTSSDNDEVVENTTAVAVKNEILNDTIENKPVTGKRLRQKLEVSKPVTDEIPVKKRRIARSSVSPDKKQDKVKKKSGGGKRKQLRPRKSVKTAKTDDIAGEGSGKLKTKIRIGKNARNIKVKKSDVDDDTDYTPMENDSSVSEVPFVITENIKTEIDVDDFGGDTDTEITTKVDETASVDDKDSSGAVGVKRRRRLKVGDPEFPGKKKRRRKRFPCNMCQRILTSQKRLVFHQFSKHGNPIDEVNYNMIHCKEETAKMFECSICQKKYTKKCRLNAHIKIVHKSGEKKSYACEICHQKMASPFSKRRHVQVQHMAVKLHQCTDCDKQFPYKWRLEQHVRAEHDGIRYTCNKCHKIFMRKDSADRHSAQSCDIRGDDFRGNSGGNGREDDSDDRVEKTTCTVCQRSFKSALSLKQHIRYLHSNKQGKVCEICGETFCRTYSLVRHIQRKHAH